MAKIFFRLKVKRGHVWLLAWSEKGRTQPLWVRPKLTCILFSLSSTSSLRVLTLSKLPGQMGTDQMSSGRWIFLFLSLLSGRRRHRQKRKHAPELTQLSPPHPPLPLPPLSVWVPVTSYLENTGDKHTLESGHTAAVCAKFSDGEIGSGLERGV